MNLTWLFLLCWQLVNYIYGFMIKVVTKNGMEKNYQNTKR